MSLRVSVTHLDMYRSYLENEEMSLEVFLNDLNGYTPRTPAMERGGAFARAMEKAGQQETSLLVADGHAFAFTCDVDIEAMPRREFRAEKDYGGVIVTGRCDRMIGKMIADDKTTSNFDAENYLDKYQWKFYLDLFEADVFHWHIWECSEIDTDGREGVKVAWEVHAHHLLKQYRYGALERDCRELALDFKDFASRIGWTGYPPRKAA